MILFNYISHNNMLLKIVLQALELFTHRIISSMEKPKLNFRNLIKDIPKTLYKVNNENQYANKSVDKSEMECQSSTFKLTYFQN